MLDWSIQRLRINVKLFMNQIVHHYQYNIKYIKQELAPDLLAISRVVAPHKDRAKKKAAPK